MVNVQKGEFRAHQEMIKEKLVRFQTILTDEKSTRNELKAQLESLKHENETLKDRISVLESNVSNLNFKQFSNVNFKRQTFNEININLNEVDIKRIHQVKNSTIEQSSPLLMELPYDMVKIMILKAAKILKGNKYTKTSISIRIIVKQNEN
jgi:predicted nuclease with TOPRIM domain